jgi:PKD repeat protein
MDDRVTIKYALIGDYSIQVVPEPNAPPTETYSLKVEAEDKTTKTIVLAENVKISDIPSQPCIIESTPTIVNAKPVAAAGDDRKVIVSESMQFNGSKSHDPDGNIASYQWDFGDGKTGSGVTVNYAYTAAGTYTVTLTVTDNNGATATDTAIMTVLTPVEAIDDLITIVNDMNLKQGINNSLDAKLQAAKDSLLAANAGLRNDAINKLQAFISAVEAQRGKELTNEQTDQLVNYANRIITALGASAAPSTIPTKFKLAQNYPNPFNPDTWIPYQLSADMDVTIWIYNVSGQLVRILNLGRKPAGFYTTKERSAYWDGKNEAGEYVASGIYFYTIKAGDFIATKKMVITR